MDPSREAVEAAAVALARAEQQARDEGVIHPVMVAMKGIDALVAGGHYVPASEYELVFAELNSYRTNEADLLDHAERAEADLASAKALLGEYVNSPYETVNRSNRDKARAFLAGEDQQ